MRVTNLELPLSNLTPHKPAAVRMPLLRVCSRQLLKIDKTDWIDFVGRTELESRRKIDGALLLDRDQRSWLAQALNVGRRSWRPPHWFPGAPIFKAQWGLKAEPQLSLLEGIKIVVDVMIRRRWCGQGGKGQTQFADRIWSLGWLAGCR